MMKYLMHMPAPSIVVATILLAGQAASACPFCSAPQQTLTEELELSEVAVFAQLIKPLPELADDPPELAPADPDAGTAVFKITEVIRGDEAAAVGEEISVVYFGDDPPEKRFMITSFSSDRIDWMTPMPVSESAQDYLRQLHEVPAEGADRLAFFQDYLEHEDPLLAQDAYDEFAKAPYEQIVALGDRIDRGKLLAWINDPNVGPSNRRLYLTLLGVCGKAEDVEMLERMLNFDRELIDPGVVTAIGAMGLTGTSLGAGVVDELVRAEEQRKKQSLDALIACYLKLKGADGLELINRRFLGNPKLEYAHMHSAIMALRFHGEQADVLPRQTLLPSMRLALDHPEFADQVVPDLARWRDWESMPRLIEKFRSAGKDDWIRQPVVSYLLVAAEEPGDVGAQAREALTEFEEIDPALVKRARSLGSFGVLAVGKPRKADLPEEPASGENAVSDVEDAADVENGEPASTGVEETADNKKQPPESPPNTSPAEAVAKKQQSSESTQQTSESTNEAPQSTRSVSRYTLISAVLLAGLAILAVLAVLIRGADPRSAPTDAELGPTEQE